MNSVVQKSTASGCFAQCRIPELVCEPMGSPDRLPEECGEHVSTTPQI